MVKCSSRGCRNLPVEYGSTHSKYLCADCFLHYHGDCCTHPISNADITKSTLRELDKRIAIMENAKVLGEEEDLANVIRWRHTAGQLSESLMGVDDAINDEEERFRVQTESMKLLKDIRNSQTYFNFLKRWFDSDQPGDAAQKEIEMLIEIEAEKKFGERINAIYQSIAMKQNSELDKLKSEISFLKNKLSESNDQIDALKGDLLNARECIDDHENFVNFQKEEIIKLSKIAENLQSENFNLRTKVKETNLLNQEINFIEEEKEIKIDRTKELNNDEKYKNDIDLSVRAQPILDKIDLISLNKEEEKSDYRFQISLVGGSMSGKTSLIQFVKGGIGPTKVLPTFGVDNFSYKVKTPSHICDLIIWDTAGQKRYFQIISNWIKSSHCIFFIYNEGISETFEYLKWWVNEIYKSGIDRTKYLCYLVGVGHPRMSKREVTLEQVKEMTEKYEFDGEFEVDLRSGQYVKEVFAKAAEDLMEIHKNGLINHKGEKEENGLNKKNDKKNKWYKIF